MALSHYRVSASVCPTFYEICKSLPYVGYATSKFCGRQERVRSTLGYADTRRDTQSTPRNFEHVQKISASAWRITCLLYTSPSPRDA